MHVLKAMIATVSSVLALLAGLVVVACVVVVAKGEDILAWAVQQRTDLAAGQDLTIGGPVSIDWGRTTTVALNDVAVSNAPWAPTPELATANRVVASVHLPALLRGAIDVTGVAVDRPVVHLSTDRGGRGNWTVLGQGSGQGGKLPFSLKVREARITDGRVVYTGPVDQPWPVVRVERLSARLSSLGGPVTTEATGTVQTEPGNPVPLALNAKVGPLSGTLRGADTYPVAMDGKVGTVDLAAKGTISGPLSAPQPDLRVSLHGTGTEALALVTDSAPPQLPPYSLDAHLTRRGTALALSDIDAALGKTGLKGTASLDFAGGGPWVEADLVSPKVHVDQIAAILPSGGGGTPQDGLIPDTPIPTAALRGIGGHAKLAAESFSGLPAPVGSAMLDATLRQGTLVADTVRLTGLGGAVEGRFTLDAAAEPARLQTRLDVQALELGQLLAAFGLKYEAKGTVDGTVQLEAAGATVQAMAGAADGTVEMRIGQGTVAATAIKYMVLGVGDVLSFLSPKKDPQTIRCLVGRFDVQDGVASPAPLLFATEEMTVRGTGTVRLGTESLDLRLVPRPADPQLLSLTVPVGIGGSFVDPNINIGLNADIGEPSSDAPACPDQAQAAQDG